VSLTVCLAPAKTIDYPEGSGHLWVYLQWALALRALGCRVIWLEGVDPSAPDTAQASKPRHLRAGDPRKVIPILKARLEPYGLAESLALFSLHGDPLPPDVAAMALDLETAATADLLINLWHSLPARVVRCFQRSVFVDTDPGLLQIWMTTGDITVAPHDLYFTVGETVGTSAARFPDCGLRWHYTPPPVFLPEWPVTPAEPGAPYTTLTHWWGGTFEFRGVTFSNEKRAAFLELANLPHATSAKLELAICLGRHYEEWRDRMEPLGWTIREAWDVSATPNQYRAYIQQSRGEFSCAKPAYVSLAAGWISDRTICYLASGKPAVVQHTGPSRFLPDADGLFRFQTMDEAVRALKATESDYERHCRLARALAEEYFDARRVAGRVLELALAERVGHPA
jgi:hypothetical protein